MSRVSTTSAWKLKIVEAEKPQEREKELELTYQECLYLTAREKGSVHPAVAEAATFLGDLYINQNRYAEAEALYRRALQIYEKTLGKNHMIYSMALRNLAEALRARGAAEEAEALRLEARGIFG